MSTQIKTCDACGQSVTYVGHRGFREYHRTCPKAGTGATDATHAVCPAHGTLVWVIGPYSAFRACADRNCTAGKRGKPHRYCAPRGTYAESGGTDEQSEAEQISVNDQIVTDEVKDYSNVKSAAVKSDINLSALGALGDAISAYVNEHARSMTGEMISEALREAKLGGPSRVDWTVNGEQFAAIEGAHHKALPRLLKLYAAGFRNFLIVGPAGSGKTTLAHNLATSLAKSFGSVSCTQGMSESALTGRPIPNLTTGETRFESTDFVRCYEAGGVFLLDEVDAADPNVMLVINSALANGSMPLPSRASEPSAKRHADSVIICAANTWGTGADRQYVGRNQLDAAFLDRFVGATIEVDYDRDLEAALVGDAHVCACVWSVRDKVASIKLRRVVGTRFLMSVARLVKCAGETLDQALQACTVGWTVDELSKAGIKGAN